MATQYKIEHDAENEKVVIRRVNDATGADLANYPKITISLADLHALTGGVASEMKVRTLDFLGSSGGAKSCAAIITDPTDGSASPTTDGGVSDAVLLPDGRIGVVGPFNYVNGKRRVGFAVYLPSLALDPLCAHCTGGADPGSNPAPENINESHDPFGNNTLIIASGGMTKIDRFNNPSVGLVSYAGGSQGLANFFDASTVGPIDTLSALAAYFLGNFSAVVCSGQITISGTDYCIWQLTLTGAVDGSFTKTAGTEGYKQIVRSLSGTKYYLFGGDGPVLTLGGSTQTWRAIRINTNGTLDTGFVLFYNPAVDAGLLAEEAAGSLIYCLGTTTTISGTAYSMVRITSAGAYSATLAGSGPNVSPTAIAIQPDTKIVICNMGTGGTVTYSGVATGNIVRIDSGGVVDGSFAQATVNDAVQRILIEPAGTIIIAGAFTLVNGIARAGIARLSAAGALLG